MSSAASPGRRAPAPPPARWRAEAFAFRTLAEARAALTSRPLLQPFWDEAAGVLGRLRITDIGRDLCASGLQEKLQAKTICVQAIGESGAGKSSLLAAIVGGDDIGHEFSASASIVGTAIERAVRMTS